MNIRIKDKDFISKKFTKKWQPSAPAGTPFSQFLKCSPEQACPALFLSA